MATIETFWTLGHKITRHELDGSRKLGHRRFRGFFGTSPIVCLVAWDMLTALRPRKSTPNHLLWALILLKQYNTETVNAALVGVNEKTFRKWSLIFINLLARMPVVGRIHETLMLIYQIT